MSSMLGEREIARTEKRGNGSIYPMKPKLESNASKKQKENILKNKKAL